MKTIKSKWDVEDMDEDMDECMDEAMEDDMPEMCKDDREKIPKKWKKGMTMVMTREMVLAHAYVPWQQYDNAFSPREALMKGTLFPELFGVYPIPD